MKSLLIGMMVVLCCWNRVSYGLTPPWEPGELEQAADLIIIGRVGAPIICTAKLEKVENGTIGYYGAPLIIEKVLKGKATPGERLSLRFTFSFYKPGVTGDQGATPRPGEDGKYYLQRLKEKGHVRIVHWSGVEIMKEGTGTLPQCR